MLLNSHISAYTRCLAEKVCGLVRSTQGFSQGEDKLGARDKILNTKVARQACAGRAPGNHSPTEGRFQQFQQSFEIEGTRRLTPRYFAQLQPCISQGTWDWIFVVCACVMSVSCRYHHENVHAIQFTCSYQHSVNGGRICRQSARSGKVLYDRKYRESISSLILHLGTNQDNG